MKKLFKLAVLAGIVTAVVKTVTAKKAEWQGLTESEVREKLHTKLDAKMPSEKVDELGDKVVAGMRQKGMLGEDEPQPVDEASTATE